MRSITEFKNLIINILHDNELQANQLEHWLAVQYKSADDVLMSLISASQEVKYREDR